MDQPGHPALVTAEQHLQQRKQGKQGIAGKPASTTQSTFTVLTRNKVQHTVTIKSRAILHMH